LCTFTEEGLVGGDEVDAGVDDYAAEHHEGGETALVEGKIREPEREEEADERDRHHEDHGERVAERLESHRKHHVHHGENQEQQPGVLLLGGVKPSPTRDLRLETDREYLIVHVLDRLLGQGTAEFPTTDEVVAYNKLVGLVALSDCQTCPLLVDAPDTRKRHFLLTDIYRRVKNVPEIVSVQIRGTEDNIDGSTIIFRSSDLPFVQ